MQGVSIVGVGRLGGALAIALSRVGYSIRLVTHSNANTSEDVASLISPRPSVISVQEIRSLDSEIVLIAVPDQEISNVASELREKVPPKTVVLHTSGSLSSSVLDGLRDAGAAVGSMHPLASVSEPVSGSTRFAGAYFCVEGDELAVDAATKIAVDLGGTPFSIDPGCKPLYHASAVMTAGHLVALFDASIETLSMCGIDRERARSILLPLLQSSVENLTSQPPEKALTGTYARADGATAERHLAAMREHVDADIVAIYLDLALRSIDIAANGNNAPEKLAALRDRILIAKRNAR